MVDVVASHGWHSFRETGRPSYYPELFLAARNADPKVLRVAFICTLFSLSAVLAVLGIRGKERWISLMKTVCSLFIGVSLLLGLYGKNWQVGYVNTPHATISRDVIIPATIGVFVGLNEFNITLSGQMGNGSGENEEHIYLSEEFHWADRLSRIAIKDFEAARIKGLPFALLTVADHLTCDFGGWKWARQNRQAGYYAHVCLWTAFAVWLLCNLSFTMVVSYGAGQMLLCGLLTLLGIVIYSVVQPPNDMAIVFEDGKLFLHYSWCYWIVLAAGLESSLLGLIILIVEYASPMKAASMFDLNTFEDDYYYYDEIDPSGARTPRVSVKHGVFNDGADSTPRESQHPTPSASLSTTRPRFDYGIANPVFEDDEGNLAIPSIQQSQILCDADVNNFAKESAEILEKDIPADSGLNSPSSRQSSDENGSETDSKGKNDELGSDDVAVNIEDGHMVAETLVDGQHVTKIALTRL